MNTKLNLGKFNTLCLRKYPRHLRANRGHGVFNSDRPGHSFADLPISQEDFIIWSCGLWVCAVLIQWIALGTGSRFYWMDWKCGLADWIVWGNWLVGGEIGLEERDRGNSLWLITNVLHLCYQKVTMKNKSNPSSVRFDVEQLEYIKKRERLQSNQSVIDFLLKAYWDVWHIPKNPFQIEGNSPSLPLKAEVKELEPKPIDLPKISLFDAYKAEILETTYSGDLEKVMKAINSDPMPTTLQKRQLKEISDNHRLNFTN